LPLRWSASKADVAFLAVALTAQTCQTQEKRRLSTGEDEGIHNLNGAYDAEIFGILREKLVDDIVGF